MKKNCHFFLINRKQSTKVSFLILISCLFCFYVSYKTTFFTKRNELQNKTQLHKIKKTKHIIENTLSKKNVVLKKITSNSITNKQNTNENLINSINSNAFSILEKKLSQTKKEKRLSKKKAEEWSAQIHKAAPGINWKDIEAHSIAQQIENDKSANINFQNGTWIERGPSNIPGRITDVDVDYQNGNIYAISDHGIVFKSSNLQATSWTAQNDRFPLGLDVATQLEVFNGGNLVSCGFIKSTNQWGVYYSTNGGITWQQSIGINPNQINQTRRLLKQGNLVYLCTHEFGPNGSGRYKIYKSSNYGASFQVLYSTPLNYDFDLVNDMWLSNNTLNPYIYMTLKNKLYLIDKVTGAANLNSALPLPSNSNFGINLLTGYESNGVVNLHGYSSQDGIGKFYSWNNLNNLWNYKSELTDWWLSVPFGYNSFTCSKSNPNELYFGSILTSKSYNGGTSWLTIDLDPTQSFALYHGDVPSCFTTINPLTNQEEMYMGTDGGLYKLDFPTQHFQQLSIPGLNCTQIYKMVSKQSSPGEMFIGTQDNGYSHTTNGISQQGAVNFTFQWGGDVTNVASGDGGESFWLWWLGDGCNYQTGPNDSGFVSNWSPQSVNGEVPYWEAPVWIPIQQPNVCYTAGKINGASGNYIIKLTAQPGDICTSQQLPFDFNQATGGYITAISISPINSNYFYATTNTGHFFKSTDSGITWSSILLSDSMYPRAILPSTINLGEVWVVGSGYSNSPVFHTTNNGQTFSGINTGLPACLAEAITTNTNETKLYLATSIGPFVYDVVNQEWSDLSNNQAPLVHYMDVEYLSTINTVRFATYARGIWDFNISNLSSDDEVYSQSVKVYPSPCEAVLKIEVPDTYLNQPFEIYDIEGKLIHNGIFLQNQELNVSSYSSGVYVIKVEKTGQNIKFIKK